MPVSSAARARRVLRSIWDHPNNRGHRLGALVRSVRWQVTKRVVGRPMDVALPGGGVVRCYPDSNSASNVVYYGALFDPVEMSFLLRYLRPGDGFIDGGANIGVYSLLAAGVVGPGGAVVAFEPDDRSRARLEESVQRSGFGAIVDVRAVALWDVAATMSFLSDKDVSNRIEVDAGPATKPVRADRLDAVLPARPWAMGKLDVEGAELHALRGATGLLAEASPPVWQIEVIEPLLGKVGASSAELGALLDDHGYDLCEWDAEAGRFRSLGSLDGVHGNVFAVARSRWEEIRARL